MITVAIAEPNWVWCWPLNKVGEKNKGYKWWYDNSGELGSVHISERQSGESHASFTTNKAKGGKEHYGYAGGIAPDFKFDACGKCNGEEDRTKLKTAWDSWKAKYPDLAKGNKYPLSKREWQTVANHNQETDTQQERPQARAEYHDYYDDGSDSQQSSIYMLEFMAILMTAVLCCIGCIVVFILGGACGSYITRKLSVQTGDGKAHSYHPVANREMV